LGEVLKEGKLLKGRYEIVKKLEETAEGAVYIARDKQGSSDLIKIREIKTKIKGTGKNTKLELAKKEAQILAGLNHSGIPKYLDFFPGVDSHYLLTEYLEGDFAEDLLGKKQEPFSFNEIAQWSIQLCEILNYLHSQEKPVIVRCIQPSSLLVTYQGDVKLMNFGMARHFDEIKTIDTVFVWNPGYTSPEQYGKQKSDNRSDIYSFGATMYNLLTKKDVGSLNFNFPPIRESNPDVPPEIEAIIMKCLAINPDERYQTISEVQQEISNFMKRGEKGAPREKQRDRVVAAKPEGQGFFGKIMSVFKKKEF
jgi:serine/threonine protein kinase, bacterial